MTAKSLSPLGNSIRLDVSPCLGSMLEEEGMSHSPRVSITARRFLHPVVPTSVLSNRIYNGLYPPIREMNSYPLFT